jgi:hypothetical protein
VCWFSAGAPSAVAAKITIANEDDAVIAYTDPGAEHPDNDRFIVDCERWFGKPVLRLRSAKYRDTWDVWTQRRFLVGPGGAPCTAELKKRVRYLFQRPDDIQVFGYTIEERHRAVRFREQNPGVDLRTPLIDRQLTKADCLAIIERAGIDVPAMYRLGYRFNNCIGCVKGGIGYWNKIRLDFPETFARMAKLERDIGYSILSDHEGPVWLDELDPQRGNHQSEPAIECSLLCQATENEFREGRD